MTERQAYIAFNTIVDLGAAAARKMAAKFGSLANLFKASEEELEAAHVVSYERVASLAEKLRIAAANNEEEHAEKLSVEIVTLADDDYPELLRKIVNPPLALYYRGDKAAFKEAAVAMVGTRMPSLYGRETAEKFARGIAAAGYVVVSGMARGIDTASHRGALAAHGRTIGVLGGALDRFYPKENIPLAREIVENGGIVMSEYPFGRSADKQTFPMRNRIVSGMSHGTLVVEAALKSGSLITAGLALEQGRTVMAVPGRIDVPSAHGCNKLIKDGAALVMSVDDVLDELSLLSFGDEIVKADKHTKAEKSVAMPKNAVPSPKPKLNPQEETILNSMDDEEMLIDDLIRKSGIDAGRVNALLITMQLKRLVEILPGGWVKKSSGKR